MPPCRPLIALCASTLVLGAFACSQTNSAPPPEAPDGSLPGTGGHGTGGASSGGGGTTDQGGTSATGGSTSGTGSAAGAGGAAGSGGSTESSGTNGTGGSRGTGGAPATGGTSGTGGFTGTGGTTKPDAATAMGGQPGTGGTGRADASPAADARPDAATDTTSGDMLAGDTARDAVMADQPKDTTPDLSPDAGASTCNLAGAATSATPTVYVIGDSTASIYASDLYPRMGWAQPLQDFFAPACATISDKALSGRSSKSFYDEGNWAPIKSALRKGDYVLIQFGHNDEKTDDPARGTDPYTTFQQYLSIYIDDVQAKGATPILLTPINRNNWSGTTLKDTHGDYPPAMRELAQKKPVSLVDMTALTKTYFERIGQAATAKLFLILAAGESPNYPSGVTDNTHLQEKGARLIAQMALAELHRQGLAPGTLAETVPAAP